MLVESLVLGLAGGLAGVGISILMLRGLVRLVLFQEGCFRKIGIDRQRLLIVFHSFFEASKVKISIAEIVVGIDKA